MVKRPKETVTIVAPDLTGQKWEPVQRNIHFVPDDSNEDIPLARKLSIRAPRRIAAAPV